MRAPKMETRQLQQRGTKSDCDIIAKTPPVRRLVVDGFKPTLLGVGICLVVALVLTRVLGSLVFGVQSTDVLTLGTVSLMLTAVGLLASAIPAWRATRVSPLAALRDE